MHGVSAVAGAFLTCGPALFEDVEEFDPQRAFKLFQRPSGEAIELWPEAQRRRHDQLWLPAPAITLAAPGMTSSETGRSKHSRPPRDVDLS
jgi:hypothetical protein